MNENSQICRFIAKNPNWQKLLEDKKIKVSSEGPLAIFCYRPDCDFTDPIVKEARGIIINIDTLEVVCWPFRKFFNWNESYADPIDWTTAKVQEKLDGSIIKLWYDELTSNWRFSTNSVINAAEANANELTGKSYLDLIKQADNYRNINFDELEIGKTYVFELVSPENRSIVEYPYYRLYHLATRNNQSGRETLRDIGIVKPAEYPLHSLSECIDAANALNNDYEIVEKEGFVVVDISFNRVKIKSPSYLAVHHTIGNGSFTRERVLGLLLKGDIDIDHFCWDYPHYAVYFRYYQFRLAELHHELEDYIRVVRNMYEEYSHERKAVALMIKDHKYAAFGFAALDNEKTAREMIDELPVSRLLNYIPEYKPEKLF